MLGVHRVDGDDHTGQLKAGEKGSHGWDLVALGRDRQLPEHGAAGVVQRGDQVRRAWVAAACTADGLAIDRDHPAPTVHRGAGPQPGTDHRREGIGIEAAEHPPERRLIRCPTRSVAGGARRRLRSGPLADRRERAGTGNDRAQPDRQ